jgi:D-beta-D-heptose 7-phosphate kinase / D-beta-D-heptose 1-phosphate adenosyltransferase
MQLSMPRFDSARVLIVGDVMLDRYWMGETTRISPEAPVPAVRVAATEDRPGGAANVALNVAALGGAASLIGLVGRDEPGEALAGQLEAAGVACRLIGVEKERTIVKLRVIARNQQLIRLDLEDRFADVHAPAIAGALGNALESASVVILSDYGKGTLSDIQALITAARAKGCSVLVDPKGVDFERYRGASLLKPNLVEFEAVVGHCGSEQVLLEKARALVEELDLGALLVTRGKSGMTLLRRGEAPVHFPTQAREVYDVTGAGDTVISTIGAALGAGEDLVAAVGLSNVAAGIAVGKLGTAAVSGPELRRAISVQREHDRGAVSEEQLVAAIADAKAAGERIVFTNGCFDILHAGHVGYLDQARALGDRLVVAINSDASVRRLKGPSRPVNTLDRRMVVLSALESVDWVVAFEDDTPTPLIEKVRPDILVKGGDYALDQVVGGEIVRAYGGEVRVLSHLDNCSTTAIVEAIRGRSGGQD